MSSILDRLKSLAVKVEAELPAGVQKITVVVEQKAEAVAAAVKRAETAVENAIPPEVGEWISKIEASIESHTAELAALFEKHVAPAAADPAPAPAASVITSDAVPTAPLL